VFEHTIRVAAITSMKMLRLDMLTA
jgi:hypothetical protein